MSTRIKGTIRVNVPRDPRLVEAIKLDLSDLGWGLPKLVQRWGPTAVLEYDYEVVAHADGTFEKAGGS